MKLILGIDRIVSITAIQSAAFDLIAFAKKEVEDQLKEAVEAECYDQLSEIEIETIPMVYDEQARENTPFPFRRARAELGEEPDYWKLYGTVEVDGKG